MNKFKFILFFYIIIIGGCHPIQQEESNEITNAHLQLRAIELAHNFIIIDTHIDLPYRLSEIDFDMATDKSIIVESEEGDFDYRRAKKGGLDAAFMSIYIPALRQSPKEAKLVADEYIDMVHNIVEVHSDKFAIAASPDEIVENFKAGKMSLPMGMENGAPIGNDLNNIAYYHDRGISYITLTHSKDNQIADSSYDTTHTWNGLSPFGKAMIKEMNKIGVMVDVSHISDSAFYQVMRISNAPVIASHSSCRYFTPGFERNMSDDMIKLLGKKEGVIQITFGSGFIDTASREAQENLASYLRENHMNPEDSTTQAYIQTYAKKHPIYTDIKKVVDHIDHVVKIAGIDHVGIGSDFDGVGDTLPIGLKDVSQYPNLILELLKRGYSEEDIKKICSKNILRVWREVEEIAAEH